MPDPRHTYYDHEAAYQRVANAGGTGWDDCCSNSEDDSYRDLAAFLAWDGLAALPGRRALEIGCGGGQAALLVARQGFEIVHLARVPDDPPCGDDLVTYARAR